MKLGPRGQCVLIVGVALVMGLPALRGGFVGVDDQTLILNHVLVNHPSWSHAVELCTIFHRDLYQPIPMLSFSAEFAVAGTLGLLDEGIERAAWLFHLTNVLLHALTSVFVWLVIKTWSVAWRRREPERVAVSPPASDRTQPPSRPVALMATAGALLFAVHPLQVEVVAWLNGRMMILSTLFAIVSIWSLGRWIRAERAGDAARFRWAAICVVCVLLSGLSKVRVGLPVVLVVLPLICGIRLQDEAVRLKTKLIGLWVTAFAITGVLAVINLVATQRSGMFSGAEEVLHGPNLARVFLALASQLAHIVWPFGLSPWYPAAPTVRWTDADVLWSLGVVGTCLLFAMWRARRGGIVLLAAVWFVLCIGDTLPFVPRRNLLAADRYMYLPMVGVCWALAVGYAQLFTPFATGPSGGRRRWTAWCVGGAVLCLLIGMSWHVISFYETPLAKATRVASLYPETPGVWTRVGWNSYDVGRYDEAIAYARRELRRDDPRIQSRAHSLIGACQSALGQRDAGLASHRQAVFLYPGERALDRLALALEEAGRTAEAIPLLEKAFPVDSPHNPGINRLADAYRRMNRIADARKQYERALTNNPYDVSAVVGLAELDLAEGSRQNLFDAEARLLGLLEWMPEHTGARINLAVARAGLGQDAQAIEEYRRVLAREPQQPTALVNLAFLENRAGRVGAAVALFDRAARCVDSFEQADVIHGFYLGHGMAGKTIPLWESFRSRYPEEPRARTMRSWSLALVGDLEAARADMSANGMRGADDLAIRSFLSLRTGAIEASLADVEQLVGTTVELREARRRLRQALEFLGQDNKDGPGTYCIAAWLLHADGRKEESHIALRLCEKRCRAEPCKTAITRLHGALEQSSTDVEDRGGAGDGGDSGR